MKPLLCLGLCLAIAPLWASAAGDPVYGRTIVLPETLAPKLQDSAKDLAETLRAVTGQEFTIVPAAASAEAPAIVLELGEVKGGAEAFRLLAPADGARLSITGNTDLGIRHGIYIYLEKLGCHWLFPNEHWTILPRRDSIRLTLDETDAPEFRLRDFFGSGGFGGKLPVDPEMALSKRWDLWKLRNRIGGDLRISGHTGEAFNLSHKKILEEHPEYLAEVGGKRQPWSMITKPCYSNPEWRKLYIQDRLTNFKSTYDQDPASKNAVAVSVEPADGGGNCECAHCLALGSFSDRVFGLANETAIALRQQYPDRFVSLLAYNEHAAPPRFELEPNVIVLSTPYAFQRTGLPGDELVKAWAAKAKTLGIYDYWSIPDWSNNLPDLSWSRTVPRKLRFWHEQGARIYLSESNFGAGNVGLVHYLAARIMWNPAVDEKKLAAEFFQLAFGPAEPPMRRMISRWDRLFLLTEHELGLCFRDLEEARALATDPAIRARVEDYALYVQYLRLWQAYSVAPRESDARKAATRKLVDWCWRIYPTAMVHSFRMQQLLCYRYEGKDTALLEEWPLKNPEAPIWKTYSKGVTPEEIGTLIADGRQAFTPLVFPEREYAETLVPLQKPATLSEKTVETPIFVGDHEFEFWTPAGLSTLEIPIRVNLRENYPGNLVTVTAPDGSTIFQERVPSNGQWTPVKLTLKGTGNYRMRVADQKVFYSMRLPANLPFVARGWNGCPALPSKAYFYVPKDLDVLAIHSESVVPPKLQNGSGAPVEHDPVALFTVPVPEDQRGRVWNVSNFKAYSPLRLLNAPPYFAFSPDAMMAPANP